MAVAAYSLGSQPKRRGRDQHLEVGSPGGPGTMEPPRVVGVIGDSVHPSAQDPEA
jgi:hypothetical protein